MHNFNLFSKAKLQLRLITLLIGLSARKLLHAYSHSFPPLTKTTLAAMFIHIEMQKMNTSESAMRVSSYTQDEQWLFSRVNTSSFYILQYSDLLHPAKQNHVISKARNYIYHDGSNVRCG